MKKSLPGLLACLSLTALICSLFMLCTVIGKSNQRQGLSYDLAELYNIKYGLFNADTWKAKAAEFLRQKIDSFALNADNRVMLKGGIEYGLGRMVDELDSFLLKDKDSKNLGSRLKGFLSDVLALPQKLRAQIPRISEQVMQELDKEKVQTSLKNYLQRQVTNLVAEADKTVDTKALEFIQKQYGYDSIAACTKGLSDKISDLQKQIWRWVFCMLLAACIGFLSWWMSPKSSYFHFLTLILLSFLLLAGGISTPMIDIDARISELYFKLLGQEIRFDNQILFFQSKSIIDVTWLLLTDGDLQTGLIGLLLFVFSILFPVSKLIASGISFPRMQLLQNNSLLRFFVLKSGKWSMADVMVVAIFMAFIGFRGILRSQLSQLENTPKMEILTTHEYTTLQPGFLLFTTFCMLSLFLAVEMERRMKKFIP